MTYNDIKLISEAERICSRMTEDFGYIMDMAKKAESDEAKNRIKDIAVSLYHKEEAMAGLG